MSKKQTAKALSSSHREELLHTLHTRFEANQGRHPQLLWADVLARLKSNPTTLWSLHEMEQTGGEPDAVGQDTRTGVVIFMDCSPESPAGRRSVCYDRAGWESRKEHRPKTTAMDLASAMGIELLSEADYLALQALGPFDLKTSSWLATPAEIRERGGALYAERRYDRVFIGHNGAQSYYAIRGFRGVLRV